MERNEVNTNPNTPWLKVIEADEGDDLVRGPTRVKPPTSSQQHHLWCRGRTIRTHDGVLVPWVATINGEDNVTVSFDAPSCSPGFEVNMDDHGSTVLPEQSPNIDLIGDVAECTASLTSSDGRGVSLVRTNTGYELAYSSPGVAPSTAMLRGTITCDDDSVNIEHTVQVFERIPVPSLFEATVHPSQPTILSIPLNPWEKVSSATAWSWTVH